MGNHNHFHPYLIRGSLKRLGIDDQVHARVIETTLGLILVKAVMRRSRLPGRVANAYSQPASGTMAWPELALWGWLKTLRFTVSLPWPRILVRALNDCLPTHCSNLSGAFIGKTKINITVARIPLLLLATWQVVDRRHLHLRAVLTR